MITPEIAAKIKDVLKSSLDKHNKNSSHLLDMENIKVMEGNNPGKYFLKFGNEKSKEFTFINNQVNESDLKQLSFFYQVANNSLLDFPNRKSTNSSDNSLANQPMNSSANISLFDQIRNQQNSPERKTIIADLWIMSSSLSNLKKYQNGREVSELDRQTYLNSQKMLDPKIEELYKRDAAQFEEMAVQYNKNPNRHVPSKDNVNFYNMKDSTGKVVGNFEIDPATKMLKTLPSVNAGNKEPLDLMLDLRNAKGDIAPGKGKFYLRLTAEGKVEEMATVGPLYVKDAEGKERYVHANDLKGKSAKDIEDIYGKGQIYVKDGKDGEKYSLPISASQYGKFSEELAQSRGLSAGRGTIDNMAMSNGTASKAQHTQLNQPTYQPMQNNAYPPQSSYPYQIIYPQSRSYVIETTKQGIKINGQLIDKNGGFKLGETNIVMLNYDGSISINGREPFQLKEHEKASTLQTHAISQSQYVHNPNFGKQGTPGLNDPEFKEPRLKGGTPNLKPVQHNNVSPQENHYPTLTGGPKDEEKPQGYLRDWAGNKNAGSKSSGTEFKQPQTPASLSGNGKIPKNDELGTASLPTGKPAIPPKPDKDKFDSKVKPSATVPTISSKTPVKKVQAIMMEPSLESFKKTTQIVQSGLNRRNSSPNMAKREMKDDGKGSGRWSS